MKQCFENSVGLCPDIVLSLDKSAPQTQRNGILCCFRKDKELSVSKQFTDEVSSALSGKREVTFKDTVDVALEDCMPENAEKTLNEFLALIKSKELVVTDRLHCMIFCVITKTPCIAFDNSNGKISAVIESWLKNCSYVRLSDSKDINGVMKDVEEMLALDADRYERFDLTEKFRPITDLINKFIN